MITALLPLLLHENLTHVPPENYTISSAKSKCQQSWTMQCWFLWNNWFNKQYICLQDFYYGTEWSSVCMCLCNWNVAIPISVLYYLFLNITNFNYISCCRFNKNKYFWQSKLWIIYSFLPLVYMPKSGKKGVKQVNKGMPPGWQRRRGPRQMKM